MHFMQQLFSLSGGDTLKYIFMYIYIVYIYIYKDVCIFIQYIHYLEAKHYVV